MQFLRLTERKKQITLVSRQCEGQLPTGYLTIAFAEARQFIEGGVPIHKFALFLLLFVKTALVVLLLFFLCLF